MDYCSYRMVAFPLICGRSLNEKRLRKYQSDGNAATIDSNGNITVTVTGAPDPEAGLAVTVTVDFVGS